MNITGQVAVGAALSQVVLTLALIGMSPLQSLSRRLFGFLMLAVLAYLLIPLWGGLPGGWLLGALSTAVPGAFWLFSASLFDDHYEFPLWQPALVALSVLMPTVYLQLLPERGLWLQLVLVELPQLGEFVFLGLALYAVFRSWRDDLLTTRRALRLWFCGIIGVFITLLILAREVFFSGEAWLESAQYLATAIIATGTNIILLRFRPGLLDPLRRQAEERPGASAVTQTAGCEEQLEPIIRLVREERMYREWGMTIGKLAAALQMPEYRLRQLINSGLGYRNFNDFLNRFRIEEASARLSDPEQAKTPVLTIALETGFRSISSFNKAFKDIHDMTPTAFRKTQLEPRPETG